MDKVEAVRLALADLGAASDEQLAAFARDRHSVLIEPRFMPIVRATLRQRQLKAQLRERQATGCVPPPCQEG